MLCTRKLCCGSVQPGQREKMQQLPESLSRVAEGKTAACRDAANRLKSSQKGFGEHLLRMISEGSGKISVTDFDAKSVSQVAWQDLRARSMQVPFVKISVKDRAQDLLDRFCVKAAVQDPCVRLAVQGVYKRSPQKISVSNLKVRSLLKLSRQHLLARSLLSSPGLCTTSRLLVVSCPDLCTRSLIIRVLLARSCGRSLGKISEQDLHNRFLGKISVQAP